VEIWRGVSSTGGAGRGPPRRARQGCWTGSSTWTVDGELAEDLHEEELDGAMDGVLDRCLRGEELTRSGLGERSRASRQGARNGAA
jgi:hypothetical protein